MSRTRSLLCTITVLASLASQASAGSSSIVVVVNSANPISSLSKGQLSSLYKGKTTEFPNGKTAEAVNLPADNSNRQDFDFAVLNMSPDEAKRFWIDMKIRSGAAAPPKLASSFAVAHFVATTASAIGYVPVSEARGLKIVARIVNRTVTAP